MDRPLTAPLRCFLRPTRMRRSLVLAAVPAALIALTACSSGSSTSSTSAAPTLGPLTLGSFPSTTDGRLATSICEEWQGLRAKYAAYLSKDRPDQLDQWLSGPDWVTIDADARRLGKDPDYTSLETALTLAFVGNMATMATVKDLDSACAAG